MISDELLEKIQQKEYENPHYCPMCESGDTIVLGKLSTNIVLRCAGCHYTYMVNDTHDYSDDEC